MTLSGPIGGKSEGFFEGQNVLRKRQNLRGVDSEDREGKKMKKRGKKTLE
jgi:hypothetical protein